MTIEPTTPLPDVVELGSLSPGDTFEWRGQSDAGTLRRFIVTSTPTRITRLDDGADMTLSPTVLVYPVVFKAVRV